MKRIYWEIVGLEGVYSDYQFEWMEDKKTKVRYKTGRAILFPVCEPPKNLITVKDPRYDFHRGFSKDERTVETKKRGFLNWEVRTVFPYGLHHELKACGGMFVPELNKYTLAANCAYVRNKKTKQEYKVEDYRLFPNDLDYVPLVEDERDEWEYIHLGDWTRSNYIGTDDMLREIMVTGWLKK